MPLAMTILAVNSTIWNAAFLEKYGRHMGLPTGTRVKTALSIIAHKKFTDIAIGLYRQFNQGINIVLLFDGSIQCYSTHRGYGALPPTVKSQCKF